MCNITLVKHYLKAMVAVVCLLAILPKSLLIFISLKACLCRNCNLSNFSIFVFQVPLLSESSTVTWRRNQWCRTTLLKVWPLSVCLWGWRPWKTHIQNVWHISVPNELQKTFSLLLFRWQNFPWNRCYPRSSSCPSSSAAAKKYWR